MTAGEVVKRKMNCKKSSYFSILCLLTFLGLLKCLIFYIHTEITEAKKISFQNSLDYSLEKNASRTFHGYICYFK